MDKKDEALKLALEALEHEAEIGNDDAYRTERDAIREALAEQPAQDQGQSCYCPNCEALSKELAALKAQQQEPVAWATQMGEYAHIKWGAKRPEYPMVYEVPLYTSPLASKPWVGLTRDERMDIINRFAGQDWVYAVEAIEAKLREKNT